MLGRRTEPTPDRNAKEHRGTRSHTQEVGRSPRPGQTEEPNPISAKNRQNHVDTTPGHTPTQPGGTALFQATPVNTPYGAIPDRVCIESVACG
jgi:hypothetical protein